MTSTNTTHTLIRNVVSNGCWYGIVVVSGFLVPRFIDKHQGKELLGIWDLGWSLQFYVGLLSVGTGSAISHYVARHRAARDEAALNTCASSSVAMLALLALLGAVAALAFSGFAGTLLPDSPPATVAIGRQVILLLGLAAATQMFGSVFNGIITGCERFDMLNVLRGARDIALLVLMLVLLAAGRGIVMLAWVNCLAEVVLVLAKAAASRRLCPSLSLSPSHWRYEQVCRMMSFGGRTMVQALARIGTYHLNSVLVAAFLGPAVLAVYARQRSLIMHVMRFVKQYAQVFLPTASAMSEGADHRALGRLLVQSSKFGMYMTLPLIILLIVMGGPLLELWMGPDYRAPVVLTVMALGHALALPQQANLSLAMAIDRHGWPALVDLGAFVVSAVITLVLLGWANGGEVSAAVALCVPIMVSSGIMVPVWLCRQLEVGVAAYFWEMTMGPVLACVPWTLGLAVTRWFFGGASSVGLLCGMLLSAAALALVYWAFVVPASLRTSIVNRVLRLFPPSGFLLRRGLDSVPRTP